MLVMSCDVIYVSMRVLIIIIMFAIGFSGYSAAAHAFDMEACGSMAMTQADNMGMDMSDCPGHQDDSTSAPDSDNDSHGKTVCLDCHHCCASHAVSLPAYEVVHPQQAKLHNPVSDAGYYDFFSFSLLRPPKTLV